MSDDSWLRTGIGSSDADSITLMGRDLAADLMGSVTLTELTFLMVQRRMPSSDETRLLDAVLVSLADHGLTPTVLAARLTHTGAPESIQGAIAAGLLGAGSVFLGVVEDTARFLDEIGDGDVGAAVARELEAGRRIPGLGHPVHKVEDPRTPRIYAIAEETGQLGPHLRRLRELADAHRSQTGRELPINGAGVAGAALADLGFPVALLRGFALLARTAGLLGHLAEEMEHPLGMPLYREVDERATYDPPTGE
jgi:citrate synthase